jgi:hypothetical protein
MAKIDIHSIPERQAESLDIKTKRWKIPQIQIYPGGYIPEDLETYSLFDSLLDIADYTHTRVIDKQAGLNQLGEDIFRTNVEFFGTPELLKEKAAKAGINVKLLQNESSDPDALEKKEKEVEKIKALVPQYLHPRLLKFLVYNLHQNSLIASPEKMLLKYILITDYESGFSDEDPTNPWTTQIRIAKDGNSFSITNTQIINCRKHLTEKSTQSVDPFADPVDPPGPIEVSSTYSFNIGDNEVIQGKCDEFCIKSLDEGLDKGLIKNFDDKISEAIANESKIRYKPSTFDEAKRYQEARDYYETDLIAYRDQFVFSKMKNNGYKELGKSNDPVVKSGFDFLRAADASVEQKDASKADLTTIFEFQACQLRNCMQGRRVVLSEMPQSLNQSRTEEDCMDAIHSLANVGKRSLAAKACIAVGTLLVATAVIATAFVLSKLCPPGGFAFMIIMSSTVPTSVKSAAGTLRYVANTAVGSGLKAHAIEATKAVVTATKTKQVELPICNAKSVHEQLLHSVHERNVKSVHEQISQVGMFSHHATTNNAVIATQQKVKSKVKKIDTSGSRKPALVCG